MAIIFEDTFTGSGSLGSHTPDTGSGWTSEYESGSDLVISGNKLVGDGGIGDGALYSADVSGGYGTADYEVSVKVVDGDNSDDTSQICARFQDTNNMYMLYFNEDDFILYKRVSGSWTTLQNASDNDIVPANGIVKLKVEGTSIKAYVDDVEKISVTDSSISAAGKAGIGIGDFRFNGDDVSNQTLDDFTVNTLLTTTTESITKSLQYVVSFTGAVAITKGLEYEVGDSIYSYEAVASLPTDDSDLANYYDASDLTDVATDNAVRVSVTGDTGDYAVHQFKRIHNNVNDQCTVTVNMQSELAPSTSTVYLRVYDHNLGTWETIDSDSATAANTDFDLTGVVTGSDYYDSNGRITAQVYQEIT